MGSSSFTAELPTKSGKKGFPSNPCPAIRVIVLNELPPSSVNGHWCRFPREAAIPFQAIPFLSVQGQAVWDLGQPRLVEGVPAYGSAIGVT